LVLVKFKQFKYFKDKLAYLKTFEKDILTLITENFYFSSNLCPELFRELFNFFAKSDILLKDGLSFFESFPFLIKKDGFNTAKAFLFYFAYRTKAYGSPMVKELLSQIFPTANITDGDEYLEFCMYCFYKGLYYIEKRNFFIATYLYCTAVQIGLNNQENLIIFNEFSLQMIRCLCFLKILCDFDIKDCLFKKAEYKSLMSYKVDDEDIDNCLDFLKNDKVTFDTFEAFIGANKKNILNYKLSGLKKEAEEMLILTKIRENIKIFKKIKLSKLCQLTNIKFEELLRVIKKKCLEGELNVKYDEENDIIEVFDVDPGMNERMKKTQELYKNLIEASKSNFISLRDKKLLDLHDIPHVIQINQFDDDDDDD
jgi:hypothetical protein